LNGSCAVAAATNRQKIYAQFMYALASLYVCLCIAARGTDAAATAFCFWTAGNRSMEADMEKVALLCVLMAIISVLAEMSPASKPAPRSLRPPR
jgi:hypothetical protein